MATTTGLVPYYDYASNTLEAQIVSPNQPRFAAKISPTISNVTGGGITYVPIFNQLIQSINIATIYNVSTGIVTVNRSGFWAFSGCLFLAGLTSNQNVGIVKLITTSSQYTLFEGNPSNLRDNGGYLALNFSARVPMANGDQAYLNLRIDGGTTVVDLRGDTDDFSYCIGYFEG